MRAAGRHANKPSVPRCYFLSACVGSSVDHRTHNATLFQLVEQVTLPAEAFRPGTAIPLEVHAYFDLSEADREQGFEMRFCLVGESSGLETYTEPVRHAPTTSRLRTRTMGLPMPPMSDSYALHVEFRVGQRGRWERDPASWPVRIAARTEAPAPRITH